MTKKQFNDKKFHLNEDFCIVKNDNRIGYDLEDTVDLLNQYYYLYKLCAEELKKVKEENNQLKQSLDYYKKIEVDSERTELKRNNLVLKTSLNELRKENEQLKEENETLSKALATYFESKNKW